MARIDSSIGSDDMPKPPQSRHTASSSPLFSAQASESRNRSTDSSVNGSPSSARTPVRKPSSYQSPTAPGLTSATIASTRASSRLVGMLRYPLTAQRMQSPRTYERFHAQDVAAGGLPSF